MVWKWDVGIRHMGFCLSGGMSFLDDLLSVILHGVAGGLSFALI